MHAKKNIRKPFKAIAKRRNVFVDANVIIDYLLSRKQYTRHATVLIEQAPLFSTILYVCSYSFAIAYHHMRNEKIPHKFAISVLEKLFSKVNILPVNHVIIQQALKSGFTDFEDAIQYFCALQVPECEAIITQNSSDFALSSIPVFRPQKFSFQD